MIQIDAIRGFFPPEIRNNSLFDRYILKEYIQLLILDYLSTSPFIRKLVLIGGTNLRLVKGIDRFSEDLVFDCKELAEEEFIEMTDNVLQFMLRSGLNITAPDRESNKLTAFRRSFYFPGFLFELGLTAHREERFMIKIESEDQHINYKPDLVNIKGCGFFFPMTVPPDAVLCAMKITAMINRQKGRDFYDVLFLLAQTMPDYLFLKQSCGISGLGELKKAVEEVLRTVNLKNKMKDFEHLLFNKENSKKILLAGEFIKEL
ncbi:MAG: nucleotidyl transferase AbiEii/AbiGii toxin family protein [Bacteroidales bacterium]